MAKDIPYFRWWVARAETDEKYASMTDEERGFYHRCLNKAWLNVGIPADPQALSRLMGVSERQLNRVWPTVSQCWYRDGERLDNRTQEEERTHATTKSERATESVRTRYERRTNALPVRSRDSRDSESESESESDAEEKNPQPPAPQAALVLDLESPVRSDVAAPKKRRNGHRTTEEVRKALGERCAWFDATWEIGPWTDGKLPGMDAYERRVKERVLALEIHAGAKRYKAKIAADPTIKVKFLQGWINDERWKDENVISIPAPPKHEGFVESVERVLGERARNGERLL